MFLEEIKNIKTGRKQLQQFGIIGGILLCLVGLVLWGWKKDFCPYLFMVSTVLFILGLVSPSLLKPVYKVLTILCITIGWFMSRVILSIVFFLVVSPIGIFGRLFGKKFLGLEFRKGTGSYWIKKEKTEIEKGSYERQF